MATRAEVEARPQAPARTEEAIEVRNPADGTVVGTVPIDGPERVGEVAARLRRAQPEWEGIGIRGRRRWLGELRDWMLDNLDEIADAMQAETGKVRAEAAGETPYLCDLINFYGANAKRFIGEQRVKPHSPLMRVKRLRVQYRPYPLVGVISPWNFPLILSAGDAVPALQAGAAVIIKPSEVTPLTLAMIVRAWREEIGAPDVLEVVHGAGETGSALVDEADFVQFTGSDRTGKKVMAQAAETLTPVSLELGGNDPMIVIEGADLEKAVNAAAWGGFANSGQVCMSVERIYVDEGLHDEFVRRLAEEVGGLRRGIDGRDYGFEQGAITFPPQMEIYERHVEGARAAGAEVLTGGGRPEGVSGDWFEPTVLAGVDHSMEVMREETFGPVVGVMKVRDSEEALRLANDSRHGLTGYVFGPKREATELARRIEAGAVCVNDVLVNFLAPDVPMGGWKDSGVGFRHASYGIQKFVRPASLVITRFGRKREPLYFPYTAERRQMLRRLTGLFNARGLRNRLRAWRT